MSDDEEITDLHENQGGDPAPLEHDPLNDPMVPDETIDETVEEEPILPVEIRLEIQRIVKRGFAWAAPLPPPDVAREFNELRPHTFDLLVDDFERRSLREDRTADHEMALEMRQMAFLEREQEHRIEESKADITTRTDVLKRGFRIEVLLIIAALIVIFFAPFSGWVVVALVAALLTPVIVTRGMALLRGRYSDNEANVLGKAMPVFKELAKNSRPGSSKLDDAGSSDA